MKILKIINNIKKFIQIENYIQITIVSRAMYVFGGIGTIWMVSIYTTPELQGYYFSFASLIMLQVFFDLGINYTIVQYISYEMKGVKWEKEKIITGDINSIKRISSIFIMILKWYKYSSILMIFILSSVGYWILIKDAEMDEIKKIAIITPWVLLVIVSSLNLFVNGLIAILEGSGQLKDVALIRMLQVILPLASLWMALFLDAGLYSLIFNSATLALTGILYLLLKYRNFYIDLYYNKTDGKGVNWRKEIYPFQLKIGLSWVSGILGFHMMTPILFKLEGAVAAGKLGMTLQILAAINGTAAVFLNSKIPIFSGYASKNEYKILKEEFLRTTIQSLIFLIIMLLSILIFVQIFLDQINNYIDRLVQLELLVLLTIVIIANHIITSQAIFLRAFKNDPFVYISIIGALFTILFSIKFVPIYGISGAVISYSISVLLIQLLFGSRIFLSKYKELN